jgi:hypothetical protein
MTIHVILGGYNIMSQNEQFYRLSIGQGACLEFLKQRKLKVAMEINVQYIEGKYFLVCPHVCCLSKTSLRVRCTCSTQPDGS